MENYDNTDSADEEDNSNDDMYNRQMMPDVNESMENQNYNQIQDNVQFDPNYQPQNNEKTLLFVNGMGGTPLTELYLVYDDAYQILKSKGVEVTRSLVGNYCTSLEMQGASITILKSDEEILKHWDAPVHTAAMRWGM